MLTSEISSWKDLKKSNVFLVIDLNRGNYLKKNTHVLGTTFK